MRYLQKKTRKFVLVSTLKTLSINQIRRSYYMQVIKTQIHINETPLASTISLKNDELLREIKIGNIIYDDFDIQSRLCYYYKYIVLFHDFNAF